MKETEAWVFAALRPSDRLFILCTDDTLKQGPPCLECRDKPSGLLAGGEPRLVRSGKKRPELYRKVARSLVEGWIHARRLSQGQQFEDHLIAAHATVMLMASAPSS